MSTRSSDPLSLKMHEEAFIAGNKADPLVSKIAKANNIPKVGELRSLVVFARNLLFSKVTLSDECCLWILGDATPLTTTLPLYEGSCSDNPATSFINSNFGRFLLVYEHEETVQILPDAAACLSVFIHAKTERIASAPFLLGDSAEFRSPEEQERICKVRKETGLWYPLGLTDYSDVELMLPNHVYEIGTETPTRFRYFDEPSVYPYSKRKYAIGNVSSALLESSSVLKSQTPFGIPITAGQDSRVLLAVAQKLKFPYSLMISFDVGKTDPIDMKVAQELSERVGVLLCINETPAHILCSLPGFGGEIGRGFYYHGGKIPCAPTPAFLVDRLGVRICPRAMERIDSWLSSLRNWSPAGILDLLYFEHRVGTTMCPVLRTRRPNGISVYSPFLSPTVIDEMLRLPYRLRLQASLGHNIVNKINPELATIPFNKLDATASDLFLHFSKIIRDKRLREPYRPMISGPLFRTFLKPKSHWRKILRGLLNFILFTPNGRKSVGDQ